MSGAPLRGLPVSLAGHVLALAVVGAALRPAPLPAFFVDLTLQPPALVATPRAAAPSAARTDTATGRPPRPRAPVALSPPPAGAPAALSTPAGSAVSAAAAPPGLAAGGATPEASGALAAAPAPSDGTASQPGLAGGGASTSHGAASASAPGGGGEGAPDGSASPAGTSAARSPGAGSGAGVLALAVPDDGAAEYGAYLAALRRRVQQSLAYPASARRRGLSGIVHLDIALDATGTVGDVLVVQSSSYRVLDEAAVEAARAVERLPLPAGLRPRPLRVRLPVVFELR